MECFIKKIFVHNFETINDEDDELYEIVDDVSTAMDIIKEFRKS